MFRRSLVVAALSVSLAAAAPVPKAPPPAAPKTGASVQLATAKVNGDLIQVTQTVSVTSYVMVPELKVVNGQNVTVNVPQAQVQHVQQTYAMTLKGTKASTADGKEIAEEDLAKRLGDGAGVVQVQPGFDPEWKKLFTDDVIFLEPTARGGFGPGFPGGGGPAILPAPVPLVAPGGGPVPVPVPLPAVAPPVEKK